MFFWGMLLGVMIGGAIGMGVCACCMITGSDDDNDQTPKQ